MNVSPYYFRYNPVAAAWVCVGPQLPPPSIPSSAHGGAENRLRFETVPYPGSLFVIDPSDVKKQAPELLLYKEQPPVGEYYVMLCHGTEDIFEWDERLWLQWVETVQFRLTQLYYNPYLHHVRVSMHTRLMDTAKGAFRVGDIVATSHPLEQPLPCLEHELIKKIRQHEKGFCVMEHAPVHVHVASAPQQPQEIWILPAGQSSCFEQAHAAKGQVAQTLRSVIAKLHDEFPRHDYILEIITSLQADDDRSWWIRIYQDKPQEADSAVAVQAYPEILVHRLKK